MDYVRLKDIGRIITGNTPPTNKPEYYGDYMPFIKATDIPIGAKCTLVTEQSYSELAAEKYIESLVPKGSTCVVTIGSIGKKMTYAHTDLFVNQAINAIVPKESYDKEYVFYNVRYSVLPQLKKLDSGTTSGRENVSKSSFSSIRIPVIKDKRVQRRIASILSTYDTLIENNTKRIRLLEKMAENLYKEWFVRFRFPGYEKAEMENGLPKGWKVCPLSKISDYTKSKAPNNKGLFYISTENMLKEYGGIDETVPSEWPEANVTKVDVGDILVSNIRPYFKKIWLADKEAGCSNDVLNIRSKEGISPIFLYYSIRRDSFFDHMVAGSNGTKMPRGSKEFTMKYSVIVPSNNVMVEFSRIIEPIIHNKRNLVYQNSLLARQRDLLLPRLMSGRLEVKLPKHKPA